MTGKELFDRVLEDLRELVVKHGIGIHAVPAPVEEIRILAEVDGSGEVITIGSVLALTPGRSMYTGSERDQETVSTRSYAGFESTTTGPFVC